jgi:hypothetical protein
VIGLLLVSQVVLGGEITGELVGPQGAPVSGGLVLAYDHRLNTSSATSDDLGTFTIEVDDDRKYWLQVLPPAGSGLAEELGLGEWQLCAAHRYSAGSVITWPLRAAARVSGRLVGPDGGGAPGVEVIGWPVLTGDLQPSMSTTDADGAFLLEGIHPGVGGVRLEVAAEDWPNQYLPQAYEEAAASLFPVQEGEETTIADHLLLSGITIAGQVYGPDGLVDGAMVRVYSPGKVRSTSSVMGWYEVSGLPPGEALSWASAEGLATTYYPDADRPSDRVAVLDEGARYEGLDLTLPAEARLHGALSAGSDGEGASVLLYNDARTVGFGAQVDADGRFEIGGLHGGEYTVEIFGGSVGLTDDLARDADGLPRVLLVPSEGLLEVDLDVVKGATVAVTARDKYSGEAIEGVSITATDPVHGRALADVTGGAGDGLLEGVNEGSWDLKVTYSRYCVGDPDWVPVYYPDARAETDGEALLVEAGEAAAWEVWLAPDNDSDEMDDVWEAENGLDPNRADGQEDLDGDGLTNLEEYRADTSPNGADVARRCGCGGDKGAAGILWLPLLFIRRRRRE